MRFAVATTALLAQALPAWTLQDAQTTLSASSFAALTLSMSPPEIQSGAAADNSQSIQKILASKNGKMVKERKNKRKSSNQGRLQKLKAAAAEGSTECNPDVGVLACGVGKYCQRDDGSSLGGVCAPVPDHDRKLEEEYSPYIGLYYCVLYAGNYDCDCESWDATTNSGSLSCVLYANACLCDGVCYDSVLHYESDGEAWKYEYCYEYKTPYEQTYCYTYTSLATCAISLDAVQCTSCTVSEDYCDTIFDCENVGMGKTTECHDFPSIPITQQCYYDPCTLCPDGVKNPTGLVSFPGYGTLYCTYLDYAAQAGFFNDEYCETLTEFVEETCCEEVFLCNICGEEDMYITMPDNTVNFGEVSATCEELVLAGQTGAIVESLCTVMPNAVGETCGCMSNSTSTESPTVAATAAPTMATTASPTMNETVGENTTDAPTAAPTTTSSVSKTTMSAIAIGLNVVALALFLQ